MFENSLKNGKCTPKKRRYTQDMKEFALTLYFYSPRAYNYVRGILHLPHPSMLRKWSASVNCQPGFLSEVFKSLAVEAQKSAGMKECALILDGMAIRKQTMYHPKVDRYVGFVDYGGAIPEPCDQLASEAVVFLLVGLRGHRRCPIAYFLTDKSSSDVQARLVSIELAKAADAGLSVRCVTCDGTSANLSTFEKLGCSFGQDYNSINFKFRHPTQNHDFFAILDPCHMLKLARNSLADIGCILSPTGAKIEWKFIKQLHQLQDQEGLKIGKKLTSTHVQYQKNKMKVSLAAQTLSSSVADAINFLNNGLQLQQFKGSESTIEFIRMVDRLFDILNSSSPVAKGFKQQLRFSTQGRWLSVLQNTAQYLLSLKSVDGQSIMQHRRKTFVIGFVTTIKSTIELAMILMNADVHPFNSSIFLPISFHKTLWNFYFHASGVEVVGTTILTLSS